MLIGISSSRTKTLDPEWLARKDIAPAALPSSNDLTQPEAVRLASQTSHLDEIFSLIAPGLRADGATAQTLDVMNDVYDASSSRNAVNCSSAQLKIFGGPTRPAIDFRSKWRPGEALGEASWTYPVMQETQKPTGVVDVLVPWRQAGGAAPARGDLSPRSGPRARAPRTVCLFHAQARSRSSSTTRTSWRRTTSSDGRRFR